MPPCAPHDAVVWPCLTVVQKCDFVGLLMVVQVKSFTVRLNLNFWTLTSKWLMMHCNLLWLTECSSCSTLSVHPPPSLRPSLPYPSTPYSNTDIYCVNDACMLMSHTFLQSLVLFWLCSCFPSRSGTLDDGRPRYDLCSFFPPFLYCSFC